MNSRRENLIFFLAMCFVFLFFCMRYWLAAQGKPFWMDESDAIHSVQFYSIQDLLLNGAPKFQASKSPLHYLQDRTLLLISGDRPQLWWDLRLYFRIIPTTWWAAACVMVGFFIRRELLERMPEIKFWHTLAISAGAATFLHSHSFMHIYAIETRAYPLWASLSVMHFLFFWRSVSKGLTRSEWWCYGFVCSLLALTTYASLIQVGTGLGILLLSLWARGKSPPWRAAIFVGFWPLVFVVYYLLKMEPAKFDPPTWAMYLDSIKELLAKSFHHSRFTGVFVTGPLLLFLIPWLKRKHLGVLETWAFVFIHLASTLVLFLASLAAGGIWGSRYVIYLIPSLTWVYFLGLIAVSHWAGARLSRWRVSAAHILLLLALFELGSRTWKVGTHLPEDLRRVHARNTYGLTQVSGCDVTLPHGPKELEALNDLCRGLSKK